MDIESGSLRTGSCLHGRDRFFDFWMLRFLRGLCGAWLAQGPGLAQGGVRFFGTKCGWCCKEAVQLPVRARYLSLSPSPSFHPTCFNPVMVSSGHS